MDLKVGDAVSLPCDDRRMVIAEILDLGEPMALCKWLNRWGALQSHLLPVACLRKQPPG